MLRQRAKSGEVLVAFGSSLRQFSASGGVTRCRPCLLSVSLLPSKLQTFEHWQVDPYNLDSLLALGEDLSIAVG